jgi:acetylornithine deacetylase/succinyl-diaminopimelate desuccinylase-like protein
VSTADSGNLSGSLVALKAGLEELADEPILPSRWREGLEDVLGVLLEELQRPENTDTGSPGRMRTTMLQQMDLLRSAGVDLPGAYKTLSALASAATQMEPMAEPESEIVQKLKSVYKQEFGSEPKLIAMHAGLECGVIGEKYPGMQMASFGPQIEHPHSPGERVKVPSVATFWTLLKGLVERL